MQGNSLEAIETTEEIFRLLTYNNTSKRPGEFAINRPRRGLIASQVEASQKDAMGGGFNGTCPISAP